MWLHHLSLASAISPASPPTPLILALRAIDAQFRHDDAHRNPTDLAMTVVDSLSNTYRVMRHISSDIDHEFASLIHEWDTLQQELRPTWSLPLPLINMVDGPSDPATTSWHDSLVVTIRNYPHSPLLGTIRRLSARHIKSKAPPHKTTKRRKNHTHQRPQPRTPDAAKSDTTGAAIDSGRGKQSRTVGPHA